MENLENKMNNPTGEMGAKSELNQPLNELRKHWGHECGGHCGHHHSFGFKPLRLLLKILIVIIIFMIGVSFGAHFSRERGSRGYYNQRQGMMGQNFGRRLVNRSFNLQGNVQANPASNVSPMMWQVYSQTNGQTTVNFKQLVGLVTKIEGNKITISSSGQTVVFNVAANAVITNAGGPISLSALKVGQNIIVIGSVDANQQFNAQAVNVQ